MRHQFIKIGTSCLFDKKGHINEALLEKKAQQILEYDLKNDMHTSLVVSGSIAIGKKERGIRLSNEEIPGLDLQMLADLGQPELARHYKKAFRKKGDVSVGQLLLTYDDLENHPENICRNIMHKCINGVYVVINYNDGTDFKGWKHDNDLLAAKLLRFCRSERLVVLGTYDGFFRKDSTLIERVYQVYDYHYSLCEGKSVYGNGGFKTKLKAAEIVLDEGKEMIVGNVQYPLEDLIEGAVQRTLFRR